MEDSTRLWPEELSLSPKAPFATRPADFTLLFEELIFTILPGVIFFVVACYRLTSADERKRRSCGPYTFTKLPIHLLHLMLRISFCISLADLAVPRTDISVAASFGSCIFALTCAVLSLRSHGCAQRPCNILLCYLSLSVLTDAARVRTLWLLKSYFGNLLPALLTAALAVELGLVVIEAMPLQGGANGSTETQSPQERNNVFSQRLLSWLNPLMIRGYRTKLKLDQLFPLDQRLHPLPLIREFRESWIGTTHSRHSKRPLWTTLRSVLQRAYAQPIVPRLFMLLFTIAQPLLLERLTEFLGEEAGERARTGLAMPLVVAYGVIYTGIGISAAWYWHWMDRAMVQTRGVLVSAVFDKVLQLSGSHHNRAVTLVTGDVEKLIAGLECGHELWANVSQAGFAFWMLQRQLGHLFLVPFAVATFAGLASAGTAVVGRRRQAPCMEAMQARLDALVSMLHSFKILRLLSLMERFAAIVQARRLREINLLRHYRYTTSTAVTISYAPFVFGPGLTFAALALSHSGRIGGYSSTFTTLGLLSLLAEPLIYLYQLSPFLAFSFVCLGRIEAFLLLPNAKPASIASGAATVAPVTSSSTETPDTSPTLPSHINISSERFGWGGSVTLTNVSLSLRPGKLTVITGPVGSGKSTLLLGLLGETDTPQPPSCAGMTPLLPEGHVAFCAQVPWLPNRSVRDVIVGPDTYDERFYCSVVSACAVDAVLRRLPDGDHTSVGPKGARLSPGQRQRVALARAVYSRRKFVLLDDVLSAVDRSSRTLILKNLLDRDTGLLRKNGSAVVLATHHVDCLALADGIITLKDGGAYSSEKSAGEWLSQLPEETTDRSSVDVTEEESFNVASSIPEVEVNEEQLQVEQAMQIKEWEICKYYVSCAGKDNLFFCFLLATGSTLLSKGSEIILKKWAHWSQTYAGPDYQTYNAVYCSFQLLSIICLTGCTLVLLQRCVPTAGIELHRKLLQTVCSATYSFVSGIDSGSIVNRFSQDLTIIDGELTRHILNFILEAITSIAQFSLLIVASRYMALVILPVALFLFFVQRFYLRTARQLRLIELSSRAPLCSCLLETAEGAVTIRAFARQESSVRDALEHVSNSQRPFYLSFCAKRWLSLVLDLSIAVLAVCMVAIAVSTNVDSGYVGVALVNLMSLSQSLRNLVLAWTDLGTAMGSIARIKAFCTNTPREEETHDRTRGDGLLQEHNWPHEGRIEFRNLTAAYVPGGPAALRDFSLIVPPGEKLAICGPSGSGKTSVMLAFLKMLSVDGGDIVVDGQSIVGLNVQRLRRSVAVIPQEFSVLPGLSLRQHVDPWTCATEQQVVDALRRVHLWDKQLEKIGLDAEIEDGMLSSGQMLLLAVAGALIQRSTCKIVLVDEATSNVDTDTARLVQALLKHDFEGCTVVQVTHRMDEALDHDRVAVLEEEKLLAVDRPEMLMRSCEVFQKLCRARGGSK